MPAPEGATVYVEEEIEERVEIAERISGGDVDGSVERGGRSRRLCDE